MFQNWIGVYDWVQEHQGAILREAARERVAETLRRRHRQAASAEHGRAQGACAEQEASLAASPVPDCVEKRPA